MIGNTSSTSFHFAVDDKEVRQGIPTNRNAWHTGDGTNGTGNRKSIGVEICYSKSGRRAKQGGREKSHQVCGAVTKRTRLGH
ncbi:N-acetylmuramoyl-L-alanine amidase [Bacillus atrophaeus]|uniref:N-acetylmuramoyl-L-alanine amidase n=1 Tax=Bacillus atrophaeus TaxID=1452 RepID=UPI00228113D9|nr:N-acetylmuramoyl-L-alanine amidase [Bacillus atrophaeus]MCY8944958.1 N-acetylmuramoyl-L-alanine amidase [Bacillus atrophaeus]